MNLILNRLDRAFDLTQGLYESLNESDYKLTIPNVPSNTFAEQAWCIVGARESYLKSLKNGKWSGFSCSLKKDANKKDFLSTLNKTHQDILVFIKKKQRFNSFEKGTLFDLLEHEIQHHGQLIRFVYSNKLSFPKTWNERYTV